MNAQFIYIFRKAYELSVVREVADYLGLLKIYRVDLLGFFKKKFKI